MYDGIHFLSYGKGCIHAGMLYPSRKAGRGEILYLHSGSLDICEGYREYRLKAGQVLLLDGQNRHYGFRECSEDTFFTRIVFEGSISDADIAVLAHKVFIPAHPERFEQLLSLILEYYSLPEYPAESVDSILRLIITVLQVDGLPVDDDSNEKLKLCSAICDYVHEKKGVCKSAEVAEHFGYTAKYLSVVFCARYARGLKSYIDAVRLSYLKLSLASDMTAAEAAKIAGFESLKSMQDFFRYNTGMTVNEWMTEH